jgi:hypothetical protein
MSIYIKVDEVTLQVEGVYANDCETPIKQTANNPGQTVEELIIKASERGKPFTGLEQIILFAQSPGCVWHRGQLWCF